MLKCYRKPYKTVKKLKEEYEKTMYYKKMAQRSLKKWSTPGRFLARTDREALPLINLRGKESGNQTMKCIGVAANSNKIDEENHKKRENNTINGISVEDNNLNQPKEIISEDNKDYVLNDYQTISKVELSDEHIEVKIPKELENSKYEIIVNAIIEEIIKKVYKAIEAFNEE